MSEEPASIRSRLLRNGEGDALLLAGPPLLVAVGAQGLFEIVGAEILDLGAEVAAQVAGSTPEGLAAAVGRAEMRLMWGLALLLNLSTAIALTAMAMHVLRRSVTLRGFRLFIPTGIVLIALGIAGFVYAALAETPISGLFSFTFDSLTAAGLFSGSFLAIAKFMVSLLNVLSVVAPVSALMAACSTLAPPRDGPGDVAFLGGQVRFLKALTVIGSAYMVSGVLHLGVWVSWPANFVAEPALAAQIESYARSISVYWGGSFTLLIAAFYVPAMVVLRHRAEAAIARLPGSGGGLTPEKLLEEHGLSLSMNKQLPQIAAVLAPLMAGPIGSAVADLSKAASMGG